MNPVVLTKHQLAYEHLRSAIISGSIQPGERIVIDSVAAELGISPIPIREAISQLAKEGLLTIRPHTSAVVSDIPVSAIQEIFALLEALELASVRLVLPRLDSKCISLLNQLCDRMEKTKKTAVWARLNREFHETLPRYFNLSRIEESMIRTGEDWERLRLYRFSKEFPEDLESANQEHREFIALLEAGKPKPVEAWVRNHNRSALKRYSPGD